MAVQKREQSETRTELQFRVHDRDLFFVRASENGVRVELVEMVQRSDGRLLEFFTVTGAQPDIVLDTATTAASIDDARVIREADGEVLFEFVVSGPCIGATLADAGAVVRDVVAEDGAGHVLADVPPHESPREVIETVWNRHDADLLARRERDSPTPAFTRREFRETLGDRLTDRQLEVLRTALEAGYFGWPRDHSAEECAELLEITQPTFNQHLRVGIEKLLRAVFDDERHDTVSV